MKKFLIAAALLTTTCALYAQQPGPESSNTNRNTPSIDATHSTPPTTATQPPKAAPTPPAPAATTGDKTAPAASATPAADQPQPAQPTTEMLPEGKSAGSADPLLEPKELPGKPMSLIGGTAVKVDQIRNRVELQPFGGGKKLSVRFDERSHVYRDGRETTAMGIHKGDRVYVDTMLIDGKVFAKNLRVATKSEAAESRGQVLAVNNGQVTMLDSLTGQNVRFSITPRTVVQRRGENSSASDVKPGSLLDVMFAPGQKGGIAQQVAVLAVPGESFIFAGKVTHLDVSTGTLAIDNESDDKNYTVYFDPSMVQDRERLTVGSEVSAHATFDGKNYHAQQLSLMSPSSAQQ